MLSLHRIMISYKKYFSDNSKEWVTFIHGAGGSSCLWFRQIRTFQKKYNVLLLDLRGHGDSQPSIKKEISSGYYTFPLLAKDVIEVLDFEGIKQTHFIGMSLGTIVIRQICEDFPERALSMILGGAVLSFDIKVKILLKLSFIFKSILPYLLMYRLLAYIIMPKEKHKESRNLFLKESLKIRKKEFYKIFALTIGINQVFKFFNKKELSIPSLYIMGEDDYMFLDSIKKLLQNHNNYSKLVIVPNSGHVCNVDNPDFFNNTALSFINNIKKDF